MASEKEELMSVRDAAKHCGKNAETVRRWIWSGKLPAEKLGNQLFIRRSDLAIFCREPATAYRATNEPKAEGRDVSAKTERMREEHVMGTEGNRYDAGLPRPNLEPEKEDFLERAIAFRDKLKARGYVGIDAAESIRQMREARVDELRQSLR